MEGMDDRTPFDELEDEVQRWATEWDESDDALYIAAKASMRKLRGLKREKLALQTRLETGGRRRRRSQRSHEDHHKRMLEDMYGVPAFDADGVVHESRPPYMSDFQFNRRYRMGPKLFARLLFEIQDPVTGHEHFRERPDACGVVGASALQKLVTVLRILAYGVAFDAVHLYTGVQECVAKKEFYAFCDWLNARYGPTYMGVWTPEAIAAEMTKNEERGFPDMLGSIDCTHWH